MEKAPFGIHNNRKRGGGVAVASLFKLAALFIKQLIIVNCAPRATRVFRACKISELRLPMGEAHNSYLGLDSQSNRILSESSIPLRFSRSRSSKRRYTSASLSKQPARDPSFISPVFFFTILLFFFQCFFSSSRRRLAQAVRFRRAGDPMRLLGRHRGLPHNRLRRIVGPRGPEDSRSTSLLAGAAEST